MLETPEEPEPDDASSPGVRPDMFALPPSPSPSTGGAADVVADDLGASDDTAAAAPISTASPPPALEPQSGQPAAALPHTDAARPPVDQPGVRPPAPSADEPHYCECTDTGRNLVVSIDGTGNQFGKKVCFAWGTRACADMLRRTRTSSSSTICSSRRGREDAVSSPTTTAGLGPSRSLRGCPGSILSR